MLSRSSRARPLTTPWRPLSLSSSTQFQACSQSLPARRLMTSANRTGKSSFTFVHCTACSIRCLAISRASSKGDCILRAQTSGNGGVLAFVGKIRGVLEVLLHDGGNGQAQHQQIDCGCHPDSQTVLASALAECVSDIRLGCLSDAVTHCKANLVVQQHSNTSRLCRGGDQLVQGFQDPPDLLPAPG